MTRKPRTDAERNRQHIVTVARGTFGHRGLNVPVRDIARQAGLGTATVYRHFPTRADLVEAALAEHVAACRADMRAALAEPDSWRALSGTIRRFAAHQVRDRGLNEAVFGPAAAMFAADRRAQATALDELVARARRDGAVRAGVTADDVRAGLLALASLGAPRPERVAAAAQRLTGLLLAGLAAHGNAEAG